MSVICKFKKALQPHKPKLSDPHVDMDSTMELAVGSAGFRS